MPIVIALMVAALLCAVAVAAGGGALASRARAQGIGDVAAVGGALAERQSPGSGCARARAIAASNGVLLRSCLAGVDGDVTLVLSTGSALGPMIASSRAGPAFAP